MKKLRMLSLFSGIGLSDYAAHKTGDIETVALCDNEKQRWEILERHFPKAKIYDNVKTLTKNMLEKDGIINENEKIDIISMSPCCQPFANCGKRENVFDERHLTPAAIKIVKSLLPKFVILENVEPFAKYVGAGDEYLRQMERANYISKSISLQGDQWGSPHKRARFYCISIHSRYASKIRWGSIEESCNNKITRRISPKIWNGELKVHNRIPELININDEWLTNCEYSGWLMGAPYGYNARYINNKKNNNLRIEEYGNSVIVPVMQSLYQFIVDCYKAAS